MTTSRALRRASGGRYGREAGASMVLAIAADVTKQGALNKEPGGIQMNSMKLAPVGLALAALMASSAIVMASNEGGFSSVVMDFVRPAQEQEVVADDLD